MKKFFTLAVAIMVLAGLAQAGTLKLVKPNGGEKWAPGSIQQIQWTADGGMGKLRLILYRNNSRLGRIALGLNATAGAYTWTTGNYQGGVAPTGDGYTICVETADDSLNDSSDAPFTIGAAGSQRDTVQFKPRPGPNDLHLAKPDLSKKTFQQVPVAKMPHIDRIEPGVLTHGAPGPSASIIGRNFGASPGKFIFLTAEEARSDMPYQLSVLSWSDTLIKFTNNRDMPVGDYRVYIVNNEHKPKALSNKVSLRIEPSEYSYIYGTDPGSFAPGEGRVNVTVIGIGFNKPYESRRATVWFNGIPRPLSVDSWSDTEIRGHVSTLLIQPGTRGEIVVQHVKGGVTHDSNRASFCLHL